MDRDVLAIIYQALQTDERIIAAWLSGSRGRGTADALSDIDIWLAVEDTVIGKINADPLAFVHAIAPTIMHIQAPSIAPAGGVFLLTWIPTGEGFEQVDWYWTPASSAHRPPETRLLLERRPIPVDVGPAIKRLEGDALDREIDGTIKDALLMIANAWKHARRGDAWRTLNHFQHIDACLSRLDWLIRKGHVPAFDDATRSFLLDTVPLGLDGQRAALQAMVNTLSSLAEAAGREPAFEKAITAQCNGLDVPLRADCVTRTEVL